MALQISGELQDALADALKGELDGGYLRLYASGGTPPADPSHAVVGTLMAIISENKTATGLTFDAAVNGVISKAAAETWIGEILQDSATYGDIDYYRFSPISDAGGLDDTIVRVQGTVGEVIGDLLLADTTVVSGTDQRVDYFSIGQPPE